MKLTNHRKLLIIIVIFAAIGASGFGVWMDNQGAGWFAFPVLMVLFDRGIR